jgi:hypothetical protein
MTAPEHSADTPVPADQDNAARPQVATAEPVPVREIGGPKGPEPTRYGDWEKKGRCIDF